MKKAILWFIKASIGGLIALGILTAFCMLYFNVPVHSDTIDGVTDYSWEKNKFHSRATEGFAWGKTNNEGYPNQFDYSQNSDIDILIMGSSHMEAFQVAMDESTASVLGNLLPHYTVYNIGTSGHDFLRCADNLTAAIDKYNPAKYVIIETSSLLFTTEQLTEAIQETIPDLPSHSEGIIGLLQKNPFLRLLYTQLQAFNGDSDTTNNSDKAIASSRGSEELYNELLEKLWNTASKSGAQLLIVYHPHLMINQDNSVSALVDEELSTFFANICEKNNIKFLDMSDIFIKEYQEKYMLPHGFSNSSIGSGHLNKYGHEMIANALYMLIMEDE